MIRWLKVTVSKANLNVFFLLGSAPFFVASLFCFEAKRKSGWGICGSFLVVVVLLVFVCLWFRDDLPKFLDHTCPCTSLLFIAYAIVRTEPSATSAKPEEKKTHHFRCDPALSVFASKCQGVMLCHEGCSLRSRDPGWGDPWFPHWALLLLHPLMWPIVILWLVVFGVLFMGLRPHGTQVVICMRRDDTKLSPLASTDLFHPLTGTRHVTVLRLCGCLLFVCVGFGLCLFLVLFLLLCFCVSVLVLW